MIQEKAQTWISALRNDHLHRRNVWFSLRVQFWPRVGYGLCSLTATYRELKECLHRQYYQVLPLCGIVRTAPVVCRTIDAGFFGVGLPHLGVKALVAMSNKLLMHYGCNTATGCFMRVSYHLLYLELGLSFHPEGIVCEIQSSRHSLMDEKLSLLEVHVEFADIPPCFP